MTTTTTIEEKKPLSAMGALLEKEELAIPEIGDIITGTVSFVSSNHALIDLGPLGSGIVLGKEMRDGMKSGVKLRVGDEVTATLVSFEGEDGYIDLSIREASHDRSWEDIETKRKGLEVVTTKIIEANKGGLMVEINGISGFLPVSQLSSEHYPRVEDGDKMKIFELLKKLIGVEVLVRILDADRMTEKLIVSEKAAQSEKERAVIGKLRVGDTISGEVSAVMTSKYEDGGASSINVMRCFQVSKAESGNSSTS
jgi:small subunit ribosomal protein S1